MALVPNALFTDKSFVWDALCVSSQDERAELNVLMETWINGVTGFFNQALNRPAVEYIVDEQLDGDDRPYIYVKQSPAHSLTALTVYYADFRQADIINVDQANDADKEVDFNESGRIVLLPEAPITRFYRGAQNVVVSYTAGLPTAELELVRMAAIEMIANRYQERGRDPREQTRSDSMITLSTFTKQDYDELPFLTRQTIRHLRKWSV